MAKISDLPPSSSPELPQEPEFRGQPSKDFTLKKGLSSSSEYGEMPDAKTIDVLRYIDNFFENIKFKKITQEELNGFRNYINQNREILIQAIQKNKGVSRQQAENIFNNDKKLLDKDEKIKIHGKEEFDPEATFKNIKRAMNQFENDYMPLEYTVCRELEKEFNNFQFDRTHLQQALEGWADILVDILQAKGYDSKFFTDAIDAVRGKGIPDIDNAMEALLNKLFY